MSNLSIVHTLAAFVSVLVALFIFGMRKGDRRHRLLGWIYVGTLFTSLVGIIVRTFSSTHPFTFYAIFAACVLLTAVLVVRQRKSIQTWRAWHAALMSLTFLGSFMAIGSIVGGIIVGNGPAFYRVFNGVIIVFTLVGLWWINTRPIIWGAAPGQPQKMTRIYFSMLVVASSALLVVAQFPMMQPALMAR